MFLVIILGSRSLEKYVKDCPPELGLDRLQTIRTMLSVTKLKIVNIISIYLIYCKTRSNISQPRELIRFRGKTILEKHSQIFNHTLCSICKAS